VYSCPNCRGSTVSFWRKLNASDLSPFPCPNCGAGVVLNGWPAFVYFAILAVALAIGMYLALATNHDWLLPTVPLLVTLLGAPLIVHYSPMTITTPARTQVAKRFRWLAWIAVAAYFAWSLADSFSKYATAP
jgi:hypothetical protein